MISYKTRVETKEMARGLADQRHSRHTHTHTYLIHMNTQTNTHAHVTRTGTNTSLRREHVSTLESGQGTTERKAATGTREIKREESEKVKEKERKSERVCERERKAQRDRQDSCLTNHHIQ